MCGGRLGRLVHVFCAGLWLGVLVFAGNASSQDVAKEEEPLAEHAIELDESGPLARKAKPTIRVGLPIPHGRDSENTRLRVTVAEVPEFSLPQRTVGYERQFSIAPEPTGSPIATGLFPEESLSEFPTTDPEMPAEADFGEPLEPIFQNVVDPPKEKRAFLREWFSQPLCRYPGVGYQRLHFALFEMDSAIPNKAMRFRIASANNYEFPDRAEYFWAKAPNGRGLASSSVETAIDYQDFRIQLETGGEKLSVLTELPIRSLDPEFNPNTTGLGDMSVGTKAVLKQTETWTLSQITRTYMNTGAITHGLSTGHVSMEPGLLFSKRYGRRTQLHGELKYWFPIAGDPNHSGQIMRYGLGASRIFRESDAFAILPTLEVVGFTVLDGQKTGLDTMGQPAEIPLDGETIVNVYPGLWFVRERKSILELGVSGGLAVSNEKFYESILRFDVRIAY
ncbi:MAG: hypothetical protein KDB27_12350 [Planctomycetales bacterium]|nr:hypothetical protein [Planctomycetales bacterium]